MSRDHDWPIRTHLEFENNSRISNEDFWYTSLIFRLKNIAISKNCKCGLFWLILVLADPLPLQNSKKLNIFDHAWFGRMFWRWPSLFTQHFISRFKFIIRLSKCISSTANTNIFQQSQIANLFWMFANMAPQLYAEIYQSYVFTARHPLK